MEPEVAKPAVDWLNDIEQVLPLVPYSTVNKNDKVKGAEIVKIVNTSVRTIADLQRLAHLLVNNGVYIELSQK